MTAVLAALLPNHEAAQAVRTRLVADGFPTDRVELTSKNELGRAKLVPAAAVSEKLTQHFRQLFPAQEDAEATQILSRGVLAGRAVITVQPRGDVETQRACEILEQANPLELRDRDLDNQPLERAASPSDKTLIPGVRKILLGPQR